MNREHVEIVRRGSQAISAWREKTPDILLNLRGAILDGAILDGADLVDAILDGANLYGATLVGANLGGATLRGATLRGARLRGATLRGTILDGAILDGADLDGANLGERRLLLISPLGSRSATLHAEICPTGIAVWTGCFRGSLEALEKASAEKHAGSLHNQEYQDAIAYIKAVAATWRKSWEKQMQKNEKAE